MENVTSRLLHENSAPILKDDARILQELEDLVQETFMLWDEKRVGFSWRYYFFNHTQRVRRLSISIGQQENADLRKLEYAALLHDITKRYDGKILTDGDGRRVIDKDGFWKNEVLLPNPAKKNVVTELYQRHNLAGSLHNVSGAFIAGELLRRYGFPDDFCKDVGSIVLAHLKPNGASKEKMEHFENNLEGRILYEADTIDANLGLVAFFRNIGIHTYSMIQRTGSADLKEYVMSLPRWLNMKEDFLPRMQTRTGLRIGKARLDRVRFVWNQIETEMKDFELNEKYGVLGVVKYFMNHCEDPNLTEEMAYLKDQWLPERRAALKSEGAGMAAARNSLKAAAGFHSLLSSEIMGEI